MELRRNFLKDSLVISDGACNPMGILHSLVEEFKFRRRNGDCDFNKPEIRLVLKQLLFLAGEECLCKHCMGRWEDDRKQTKVSYEGISCDWENGGENV